MLTVFLIVTLIGLNALCVAAEFSAVSARESRVRKAADLGRRSARWLLPILREPLRLDRYIASCQLGITTTSIALGAYCQSTLTAELEPLFVDSGGFEEELAATLAFAIVLLLLTILQVMLGEQVPKSMALHRPSRVAMWTVTPVVVGQWIFGPVITFLNGTAQFLLRLLRAPHVAQRHVHSRQEIDLIMAQSHERGVLNAAEHERLQQVLDLEVITARQLMVPRREIVAIDLSEETAVSAHVVLEGEYSRLPVYEGGIDEIKGIIHTKDLARHAVVKGSVKDWRKLIRPIDFINEGMTADRLLSVFREKQTQQAIVMDEFGGVAGLVTLEDMLTHVFGEVGDEFRRKSARPRRLPDGRLRLPGRLLLDEVEEWLDVTWAGYSTTVGGFVTEQLGHLPHPGEVVELPGFSIEVEKVENRVVASVLVTTVGPPEPASIPSGEGSGG